MRLDWGCGHTRTREDLRHHTDAATTWQAQARDGHDGRRAHELLMKQHAASGRIEGDAMEGNATQRRYIRAGTEVNRLVAALSRDITATRVAQAHDAIDRRLRVDKKRGACLGDHAGSVLGAQDRLVANVRLGRRDLHQ